MSTSNAIPSLTDATYSPVEVNSEDPLSPPVDTGGFGDVELVEANLIGVGRSSIPPAPPSAPEKLVTQNPPRSDAPGQAPPPAPPAAVKKAVPRRPATEQANSTQPVAKSARPTPAPTEKSVPPPPPPRASLPALKQPVATATAAPAALPTASGVGSAKGIRWRGELHTIRRPSTTNLVPAPEAEPLPDEEVPEVDQITVSRTAPPWLVSMIIHLIMLLVLAFIASPTGSGLSDLLLTIGESDGDEPVELVEFEVDGSDAEVEADTVEDSEVEVPMETLVDAVEPIEPTELVELADSMGPAVAVDAPMFGGRSGATKDALMALYGGNQDTQDAVELGLAWLKRQQFPNGSWSMRGPYNDGSRAENRCAATSMAVLAFLGNGQTHQSGAYKKEVEKALRFLVSKQDRSGLLAHGTLDDEMMYAQAQGTIALCEAYGMTGDSWLKQPAQLAIKFAEQSQARSGGWRYRPRQDSDTSVTGWFVMALKSGISARLNVDNSVLQFVTTYLDSVESFDGAAYGYQRGRPASAAMTAEGLLCRQYLGWERDRPAMREGTTALVETAPFNIRDGDVYYWYYATQVLHHYGGDPWTEWNSVMRVQLPKAQITRGKETGSWAPQSDKWGSSVGRMYTTCLSLYCLEVYYRHMPLYKAK